MGLNILSLCDGMACARIALEKCNIKVDNYFASEIKEIAIKCATANYPDIVEIGNVKNVSYQNGILKTEKGDFEVDHFDLVCFGFPCQTLSIAMPTDKRIGLENLEKSGLFYECYRILKEVNPSFFFIENVASMKEEDKKILSELIGCEPVKIDSQVCAPAMRKRLYWTNLPHTPFVKDDSITLSSVLDNGWVDRKKARALLAGSSGGLNSWKHMPARFRRYYYSHFDNLVFESEDNFNKCLKLCKPYFKLSAKEFKEQTLKNEELIKETSKARTLSQTEMEKCMTVPIGYTKMLTRDEAYNVLGDGWTIDVICHFFEYLTE